jgi:hypothetical protein
LASKPGERVALSWVGVAGGVGTATLQLAAAPPQLRAGGRAHPVERLKA